MIFGLTVEQIVTIITLVGGGLFVVWKLFEKILLATTVDKQKDERDHRQTLELQEAEHKHKSQSQEIEALIDLLKEQNLFMRETVIADNKRLEDLMQQVLEKQVTHEHKISLLISAISRVYERDKNTTKST